MNCPKALLALSVLTLAAMPPGGAGPHVPGLDWAGFPVARPPPLR
jgi:hypothetical protein